MNKREFAKMILNKHSKTFVIYVTTLKIPTVMPIYFLKISQVQRSDKPILADLQ